MKFTTTGNEIQNNGQRNLRECLSLFTEVLMVIHACLNCSWQIECASEQLVWARSLAKQTNKPQF